MTFIQRLRTCFTCLHAIFYVLSDVRDCEGLSAGFGRTLHLELHINVVKKFVFFLPLVFVTHTGLNMIVGFKVLFLCEQVAAADTSDSIDELWHNT
jgi:hypothetical protein